MKKLLALALSVCMLFATTTTASASEAYGEGSASAPVTYHVDSEYAIYIPETINLNEDYKFQAAYLNIAENECVTVAITNLNSSDQLQLSHNAFGGSFYGYLQKDNGESISQSMPNVAKFVMGMDESLFSFHMVPVADQVVGAGDYSGTAEFYISLQPN